VHVCGLCASFVSVCFRLYVVVLVYLDVCSFAFAKLCEFLPQHICMSVCVCEYLHYHITYMSVCVCHQCAFGGAHQHVW
jgi:hypothetical protein